MNNGRGEETIPIQGPYKGGQLPVLRVQKSAYFLRILAAGRRCPAPVRVLCRPPEGPGLPAPDRYAGRSGRKPENLLPPHLPGQTPAGAVEGKSRNGYGGREARRFQTRRRDRSGQFMISLLGDQQDLAHPDEVGIGELV